MADRAEHEPDGALPDGIQGARAGADDDLEREWPWVDVLSRGDRRMFAEEMSQLMAEAAETDNFAEVQQTLREWRVTSEIYLDPELLKRLTEPRTANGDRVPRPVV